VIRRPADMQAHERECDAGPLFRGADIKPELDDARLSSGYGCVLALCRDGAWRTKGEVSNEILRRFGRHVPEESVGRYLRYTKEAGWDLEKRRLGDPDRGLYEYRIVRMR